MNKGYLGLGVVLSVAILSLVSLLYYEYLSDANLETREIGLLFPTTGDFATHGNENIVAANMAINDFNEHLEGLDKDWRLNAVTKNSETDPIISLNLVKELYAKNIRIIIGPETSAELALIKPYADNKEILILSPTSTAPSLAVKDNIYRLAPDDTNQGHAITALLKKEGIQAIILITRDDTWGNDLSTSITTSFVENKIGDASFRILYDPSNPNYDATANDIFHLVSSISKSYDQDKIAVVVIGFGESTEFLKSAHSESLLDGIKWFGTDSNANERKITEDIISLEFANKVGFTAVQFGSVSNEIHDDVEKRLIEKLGFTPSTYAYSSYDAVWIIGQSILEVNSTDPKLIHDVIEEVASSYVGTLGDIKLNDAGDLNAANYDIWEIVDDTWKVTGYYDYLSGEIIK
jgi:branched-chain amino acid transport system substrate-binding protein